MSSLQATSAKAPHSRDAQSLEQRSSSSIAACELAHGLVRPAYDSFCFAHLPGLVEQLLTGETKRMTLPADIVSSLGRFDHVVSFFFDAFGWRSFERFRDRSPILKAFAERGLVIKATSQFPSTTAAHVTTEYSGKPAFVHEVCGWDYFEPVVGQMIKPLKFSYSEDPGTGQSLKDRFAPSRVFCSGDFIPNLTQRGVEVYKHGPSQFFPSPFGEAFCPRDRLLGYSSPRQGVTSAERLLQIDKIKSYQSIYVDAYDSVCHRHGVVSSESDGVAKDVLSQLGACLRWRPLGRTLLLLYADHGQISTERDGVINILDVLPDLPKYLKTDILDRPIRFSGGARQLFLHVREDCVTQLCKELQEKLGGAARVMTIEDACKLGMFGLSEPTETLRLRVGTVVVLPLPGYVVGWIEPPAFRAPDISCHGGSSKEEMEIPLLMLPLE